MGAFTFSLRPVPGRSIPEAGPAPASLLGEQWAAEGVSVSHLMEVTLAGRGRGKKQEMASKSLLG